MSEMPTLDQVDSNTACKRNGWSDEAIDCTGPKENYVSFLESAVRNRSRLPGNLLEVRARNTKEAVGSASSSSLFFTSRPLETALLTPFSRAVFLGFIARDCFYFISALMAVFVHNGSSHFNVYRLSNIYGQTLRPGISEIGLLSRGLIAPVQTMVWVNDSVVEIHVDADAPIDGWHVILPAGTPFSNLRQVASEGSMDGEHWQRTVVPWLATITSRTPFVDRCPEGNPQAVQHFFIQFQFTAEVLATWLEHPVSMVGLSLIILFSFKADGKYARVCAGWTFSLLGLCSMIAMCSTQDSYHSLDQALLIFVHFSHAFGFFFLNHGYLFVIAFCGLYTIVCGLTLRMFFPHHDLVAQVVAGIMQFLIFVSVLCRRQWVLSKARNAIKPDVDQYERVWQALTADTHATEELEALRLQVNVMTAQCCADQVRQMTRHPDSIAAINAVHSLRRPFSLSSPRPQPELSPTSAPVCSLDQLFHQAWLMSGELKRKVVGWARNSGGMFLCQWVEGGSAYRTAQELDEGRGWGLVKWAGVKKADRAIQKLTRNYSLDPSRLVDLCRQSIVFKSISDLTSCLRSIHSDPTAVCQRVKNRLTTDYDPWTSAGYRDVAVNLRIVTAVTEQLGVEEHVCELQLILKCFADKKHDQGHARYVEYRNLRAE